VAWLLVVVLGLGLVGSAGADTNVPVWTPGAEAPPGATNLAFLVGEEMHYTIHWGFLHVGDTIATTEWVTDEQGRTRLLIRFRTKTNGLVEKLYPVEDLQEVMIDPDTLLPVYFYKKSRQGSHEDHERTSFDHAAGTARFHNFLRGTVEDIPIDADTRDLISLMYSLRGWDYPVGGTLATRVLTDKKVYDLSVKVVKKEKLDLKRYGRVASLRLDPEAKFDGLFVRKGKMTVWVSDDARRLCTRISAKVPVASVTINLERVLGPGNDFWVGKATGGSPEVTVIHKQ
jgi:hypothetical protein